MSVEGISGGAQGAYRGEKARLVSTLILFTVYFRLARYTCCLAVRESLSLPHTHTHTRARANTHTHTHTHMCAITPPHGGNAFLWLYTEV